MGTNDLAKELHAEHVPGRHAAAHRAGWPCLLAARAAGKAILDGVYNDVQRRRRVRGGVRPGARAGLRRQDPDPSRARSRPANRVFAPSDEEVEHARRIIAAFEDAQAEGRAVATLDGRLVESLHVDTAHRVLAMHAAVRSR